MGQRTHQERAIRVTARPHVVVATLIGVLPRLGCRLRAVEDFGMTVRFTADDHTEPAPRVLVAHVFSEDDVAVVRVRPLDLGGPVVDERAEHTISRLLAEIAARVEG
jgi:hypothetical protein